MTTSEVAKFAGVSIRQLQWWDDHGIVSPKIVRRGPVGSVRGERGRWAGAIRPPERKREYSADQARAVYLLGELRKMRVPFPLCLRVLTRLNRQPEARFFVVSPGGWIAPAGNLARAIRIAASVHAPVWIAEVKGASA